MTTPAGWYDDGSGRQRWWDGTQWTEHYAPVEQVQQQLQQQAPTQQYTQQYPQAQHTQAYAAVQPAPGPTVPATLGFIGLGLAVLGTILVLIPTLITVVIGWVVLLAAFVISLIAVFKKHTRKWPSITGLVLSLVGGMIGLIMFTVVLFAQLLMAPLEGLVTDIPTPAVSEPTTVQPAPEESAPVEAAPTEPSTEASATRPSPEEIADGALVLMNAAGITQYNDDPEFQQCFGQFLYDSELSDAAVQTVADGVDLNTEERELGIQVTRDAVLTCDPQ